MIVKKIYDYIKFNISDIKCYLYNRPTNSNTTDLVLSQVDDNITIEVFANNVNNDKTFPNFEEFSRVFNALSAVIPMLIKKGELKRNTNGYWSQVFEFKAFEFGNGKIRQRSTENDGYGGVTTSNVDTDCVLFIDSWNLASGRVDISVRTSVLKDILLLADGYNTYVAEYKPYASLNEYLSGSAIVYNNQEFVINEFKPINEYFTQCLTYKKSLHV